MQPLLTNAPARRTRVKPPEPGKDCNLCERLAEFRTAQRIAHPDWHNAPVPSFGLLSAQLLVVGLAPGLRGANCTGRPFTGDHAGDLLYSMLAKWAFAQGTYERHRGDRFRLADCRVTNAVRCVPPQNKPTGPETRACRDFLAAEIRAMPKLKVILALGRIAHEATLRALGLKLSVHPFTHGALHELPTTFVLADSYHCSRLNTNTGRLTEKGFSSVIRTVRQRIDGKAQISPLNGRSA